MLNFLKKITKVQPEDDNSAQNFDNIDSDLIEIIKNLLSDNVNITFDIGSHHGRYSKALHNIFKQAKIYCFEPFPASFQLLKENLTSSNFHIYPLAVSDVEGKTSFYSNVLDETNSLLPSAVTNSEIDGLTANKKIIQVDVVTLDIFCAQEKIDCIDILKIDAQGNTLNVLKGATELITNKKIKIIQCEVEFLEIYQNQFLFHHVTSFLQSYNYSLYSLYNLHFDVNNRISWADAIYFIENDKEIS